jgi:transposase
MNTNTNMNANITNLNAASAQNSTVAVDLAKSVFELAIGDGQGRVTERKRLSREAFSRFFINRPPCRIVMEACGTAHYWARTFQALGHEVKLLPPQHVRPYVRRNKTDRADASALLEADRCGDILPAPVKSEGQQALQGLHRVRSGWMAARTARIDEVRGLLREFGFDLAQGPAAVMAKVPGWLADEESKIPPVLRQALSEAMAEIRELDTRIDKLEKQLREEAKQRPAVLRLMQVPGIGLLIATALAGAVGGMEAFHDGRRLAAWLGLTPKEAGSGLKRQLGRIGKRGDPYLRTLLVHGARSALNAAAVKLAAGKELTRLQRWALELAARVGHNKAACALANKLARIAYAVVRQGRDFDGDFVPSMGKAAG